MKVVSLWEPLSLAAGRHNSGWCMAGDWGQDPALTLALGLWFWCSAVTFLLPGWALTGLPWCICSSGQSSGEHPRGTCLCSAGLGSLYSGSTSGGIQPGLSSIPEALGYV